MVEAVRVSDGPRLMVNLTVAHVATYAVGLGCWVVHNVDEWQLGLPEGKASGIYQFIDQVLQNKFQIVLPYVGSGLYLRERITQHVISKTKGFRYSSTGKLLTKLYNIDDVRHVVLPFPDEIGSSEKLNALAYIEQIRIWQLGGVSNTANSHSIKRVDSQFMHERITRNPVGTNKLTSLYEFARENPYGWASELLDIPDEFCDL